MNHEESIRSFLLELEQQRKFSAYTIEAYRYDLFEFFETLESKETEITHDDIMKYQLVLHEKGRNERTIMRKLSALRSYGKYLYRNNLTSSKIEHLIQSQKSSVALPEIVHPKEFQDLIDMCDQTPLGLRNRALLEFLFGSGLRVSELTLLNISDIQKDSNAFRVLGKGNKERDVFLNHQTYEAFLAYFEYSRPFLLEKQGLKNEENALFLSHRGTRLTPRGVNHILKQLLGRAGITRNLSAHKFRHAFATQLLSHGADLRSVQELLGHEHISTTQTYTHVSDAYLEEVYKKTHPRS